MYIEIILISLIIVYMAVLIILTTLEPKNGEIGSFVEYVTREDEFTEYVKSSLNNKHFDKLDYKYPVNYRRYRIKGSYIPLKHSRLIKTEKELGED